MALAVCLAYSETVIGPDGIPYQELVSVTTNGNIEAGNVTLKGLYIDGLNIDVALGIIMGLQIASLAIEFIKLVSKK